jgi:hypothetical protein
MRKDQLKLMEYLIEGLFSDASKPILELGIPLRQIIEVYGGATGMNEKEIIELLFELEQTEVIYFLNGFIFAGDPTKPRGLSWSLMKELCSLALNPNDDAKEEFRNFWKRIGEREDFSNNGILQSQLETVEQLDTKQPRRIERMVIGDILSNIRVTANNPNQIRSKYHWFT